MVIHSAIGTASQMPFTPIKYGRMSIFAVIKTNVRTNEMTADIFPSENAVNMEEANIFMPANK